MLLLLLGGLSNLLLGWGLMGGVFPEAIEPAPTPVLRVCADPNNLPFSNREQAGFENKIAALFARSMGAQVEYTWWLTRFIRRMIRNTLLAGRCDIIFGLPHDPRFTREVRGIALTEPYYVTGYALVYPKTWPWQGEPPRSVLDLPKDARIGVWIRTPPQDILAIKGYARLVSYHPWYPGEVFADLHRGVIDLAVVWGPTAGYYNKFHYRNAFTVRLIRGPDFAWSIAAAVRKDDVDLLQRINSIIQTHREEIYRILQEFGIPHIRGTGTTPGSFHPNP